MFVLDNSVGAFKFHRTIGVRLDMCMRHIKIIIRTLCGPYVTARNAEIVHKKIFNPQIEHSSKDAFQRCIALRSSNRQHQLRSPVKGLTSRTLLVQGGPDKLTPAFPLGLQEPCW